ncbi:dolichol-phosphate mannosyltransferase subunit 3 [Hypanus sabinus]|uniref:dolichol-phosphate mannosyltransferase subunit 3 n=1 Tax=Hypanus sabinus TaxID=79690 RepID=UPI0028C445F1|nr:dolichol-phosphate mannosyltransferase subunit 3 [Hypanus sabinus]
MTKLTDCILSLGLLTAVWAGLVFDPLGLDLPKPGPELLWPLPAYLLVCFGCYSLATVGFRLASFNDCPDAATELQRQIHEARRELAARGFRFPEPQGSA